MAKAWYEGVANIARKVTKPYRGVDGVSRRITKGYRGENGVARQYFQSYCWEFFHGFFNLGNSINPPTVHSSSSGIEANGSYVMRINSTGHVTDDKCRAFANCILYDDFSNSGTLTLGWTGSQTLPACVDKKVVFYDVDGNVLIDAATVGTVLSPTDMSGIFTTIVPANTQKIEFVISNGTAGTYDLYFSLDSLNINGKVYI